MPKPNKKIELRTHSRFGLIPQGLEKVTPWLKIELNLVASFINQEMFWNQIGQFCFRNLDHQLNDVDPIDFLTITSFEIQRLDSNTSRSSATV